MKKLLLMVLVACVVLLPAAAGAATTSDEQTFQLDLGSQYNVGLNLETSPKLVEYLRSKDSSLPDPSAGGSPFDYSAY